MMTIHIVATAFAMRHPSPMRSTRRKRQAPDVFEGVPTTEPPSPSSHRKSFLLPSDLATAIKHLDDAQLDTLFNTVRAELDRRGKQTTDKKGERVTKKRPKDVPVQVPPGQISLIRAALKAGVKPGAIARQLRISPSVVRRVLAKEEKPGG